MADGPQHTAEKVVTVSISARDAGFAVEHLRYLASQDASDAAHAAANLSAMWLANQIEAATGVDARQPHKYRPGGENGRCLCGEMKKAAVHHIPPGTGG